MGRGIDMVKTGKEATENAWKYTGGDYVYWYGGKGEKCTLDLLNRLRKAYPSIYNANYITACKKDISAGKKCIDCSGLVCKAYGIADIGTYQMATDSRLLQWTETPRDGMIVWKWTHCGIYLNGYVIEARGKAYGVTTNRKYKASEWQRVLYMKTVDYGGKTPKEILQAAADVIDGKYGTGDSRKTALKKAGFDADKVQKIVNEVLK